MPKPKKADPGDGCLYQRTRHKNGRNYKDNYVIIARNEEGKQIRITLGTKDYTRAKEMLRVWQVARSAGDDAEVNGRMTVVDYDNRWLARKELDAAERGSVRPQTIAKYKNYLAPFNAYLTECGYTLLKVKDLKAVHLKGYQAWRLKQTRFGKPGGIPISPEGINREVQFLKGVFKGAYHDRLVSKDPAKGVEKLKTNHKKILLPSARELWEVFQETGDQAVTDYGKTIALTGMRAMEGMSRKFK
ncbi:MAG: phage integrase SAM-like domain-containing protein, partial [Azoarcus sp.]|nr:phage integrase SAM-like domain-containing protein [Azoarcus sp.]